MKKSKVSNSKLIIMSIGYALFVLTFVLSNFKLYQDAIKISNCTKHIIY